MTMGSDRREFLFSALFAGGAVALPEWLSRWFGQDPANTQGTQAAEQRERVLRAAVQKAKDHGKPLLVFVLPAESATGERWHRSQWFGAFLNHGGSLALLEVALCVPVCATLADVRTVTGAASIEGDQLLLVVDVAEVGVPDAPAAKVTPLVLDLGDPCRLPGDPPYSETWLADVEARITAGLEKLTAELHRTIHLHGDSMAKLVEAARAHMNDEQRAAVAAFVAGGKAPDDDLLVRAAAEIRGSTAGLTDAARKRLLDTLCKAVERTLVLRRVPGGLWRRSKGCGSATEDENGKAVEVAGVACGMGNVPRMCERFLDLYSSP